MKASFDLTKHEAKRGSAPRNFFLRNRVLILTLLHMYNPVEADDRDTKQDTSNSYCLSSIEV